MGSRIWVPTVSGPLASFSGGFETWLLARGYSPWTVSHRLWQLDLLSRWLEREGFAVGGLTAERAKRFALARRAAGWSTWVSPRGMLVPLEYLREIGVVPPSASPALDGRVEELLAEYRRYLLVERGLAEMTIYHCDRAARVFLEDRLEQAGGRLALERLSAGDVSGFLVRECPRRSIAMARDLVTRLRNFLRYLHLTGVIDVPLVWAVPGVADQRDRTLPRGLAPAVVKQLLASCDRRRLVGRRDYAILLLLSRLGLRSGEVAAIQLDDIDWRGGELLVRGKRTRHELLPLPVDAGRALVSYLQRRGRHESRALFLKVVAPIGPISSDTVHSIVMDACRRAGVPPVGPHRLRHTAATEMLRRGASLAEIALVLRHREIKMTAGYAKVDRKTLRPLALPWPGERP
jgi:integrase/recombinase XerD